MIFQETKNWMGESQNQWFLCIWKHVAKILFRFSRNDPLDAFNHLLATKLWDKNSYIYIYYFKVGPAPFESMSMWKSESLNNAYL